MKLASWHSGWQVRWTPCLWGFLPSSQQRSNPVRPAKKKCPVFARSLTAQLNLTRSCPHSLSLSRLTGASGDSGASSQTERLIWVSCTSSSCTVHPDQWLPKHTAEAAAQHTQKVILTHFSPAACKLVQEEKGNSASMQKLRPLTIGTDTPTNSVRLRVGKRSMSVNLCPSSQPMYIVVECMILTGAEKERCESKSSREV